VREADEAQHPEMAKNFEASLFDAGSHYIPFNISLLLDVHCFI
jgi:hypothetical protein